MEFEEFGGLKHSNPHDRESWVVRLRFKQNEEVRFGTGFYLNVPASKWYIILTAAHNLVDEDGNPSEDLHVERRGQASIPPERLITKFCPDYQPSSIKGQPTRSTANIDYGVILTEKHLNSPNIGFGFALKLSQNDLCGKQLELSGCSLREEVLYETQTYTQLSGTCLNAEEGFLAYQMSTTVGLSGSPVHMPYKGFETVVAIHNNGPTDKEKGSKGARLSCKTMEHIFEWAELLARHKALRARASPDNRPFYLQFLPYEEFASVHCTRQGLDTFFDVFPAYAAPSSSDKYNTWWVFRVHPVSATEPMQRWVLWDIVKNGVILTESLQDNCFARLLTRPSIPGVFNIVLADPATASGQLNGLAMLCMDANCITVLDQERGDLNGSGLSFSRYVNGRKQRNSYNQFLLE